jgi:hypothetical protein
MHPKFPALGSKKGVFWDLRPPMAMFRIQIT